MRTLIVDSSILIGRKMNEYLADIPEIQIVGETSTFQDALRLIQDLAPRAVMIDARVLQSPKFQLIHHLKSFQHSPYVIVLFNGCSPEYTQAYQNAGADYVFDKSLEFSKAADTLVVLSQR